MSDLIDNNYIPRVFGNLREYYNQSTPVGKLLEQSFVEQLPVSQDLKRLLSMQERRTDLHVQSVIENICNFWKGKWNFDISSSIEKKSNPSATGFHTEVLKKH